MQGEAEKSALESFHNAAARVPAYGALLKEAGIRPDQVNTIEAFRRLPVVEKRDTFQRFKVEQLCVDGSLGRLGSVLTSSGHSGIFAFGLTDAAARADTIKWTDDSLDLLFNVRSRPTLLINCLPMGVKISTQICTLAETSVRADMAVGLVRAFGGHFAQIILVGEAAFIKHLLELGRRGGVEWRNHRVHIIVGEEPLAENARKYFESILGLDVRAPDNGIIISSMGIAELGLNLFFEAPPKSPLILLRRFFHENPEARHMVFGKKEWVPSLFTYDPGRIFVEFDDKGRLILTTLDLRLRLPLIRYAPGDRGHLLKLPGELRRALEAADIAWDLLEAVPIVAINGRGEHALAGETPVYPEAVKEGIYQDHSLVELTTANFRVVSGPERARIRIQLSPGVTASSGLEGKFRTAISRFVSAPFEVVCEHYESFGSGMALDYERKFSYLGP